MKYKKFTFTILIFFLSIFTLLASFAPGEVSAANSESVLYENLLQGYEGQIDNFDFITEYCTLVTLNSSQSYPVAGWYHNNPNDYSYVNIQFTNWSTLTNGNINVNNTICLAFEFGAEGGEVPPVESFQVFYANGQSYSGEGLVRFFFVVGNTFYVFVSPGTDYTFDLDVTDPEFNIRLFCRFESSFQPYTCYTRGLYNLNAGAQTADVALLFQTWYISQILRYWLEYGVKIQGTDISLDIDTSALQSLLQSIDLNIDSLDSQLQAMFEYIQSQDIPLFTPNFADLYDYLYTFTSSDGLTLENLTDVSSSVTLNFPSVDSKYFGFIINSLLPLSGPPLSISGIYTYNTRLPTTVEVIKLARLFIYYPDTQSLTFINDIDYSSFYLGSTTMYLIKQGKSFIPKEYNAPGYLGFMFESETDVDAGSFATFNNFGYQMYNVDTPGYDTLNDFIYDTSQSSSDRTIISILKDLLGLQGDPQTSSELTQKADEFTQFSNDLQDFEDSYSYGLADYNSQIDLNTDTVFQPLGQSTLFFGNFLNSMYVGFSYFQSPFVVTMILCVVSFFFIKFMRPRR